MTDLDPLARAILEAGREGDNPTPDERARARRALLSAIAAPGGGSGSPGHSAVGHGSAAATKTVAAALGKLAAVGVAVWFGSSVLLHLWPQQKQAASTGSAPATLERAAAPRSAPAPVRPASSAPALRSPHEGRSRPVRHPGAVAGNVAPAAPRSPSAAAASASVSVAPPSATARFAQAPSAAPAGDTLAAETRDLRSAYAAMERGDPARALALLDQQSAAYPHGQLGQERRAARVFALCKLGRTAEARAAAARFLAQSPGSPLAGRVRKACAAP